MECPSGFPTCGPTTIEYPFNTFRHLPRSPPFNMRRHSECPTGFPLVIQPVSGTLFFTLFYFYSTRSKWSLQGCVDSQKSLAREDRPWFSGTTNIVTWEKHCVLVIRNNTDWQPDRLINWQYLLPPIKFFYTQSYHHVVLVQDKIHKLEEEGRCSLDNQSNNNKDNLDTQVQSQTCSIVKL